MFFPRITTILFSVSSLVLLSSYGYGAENKITSVPLVRMLQEGKVNLSPDRKSIIDENGHIVAKQTSPPVSPPAAQIKILDKNTAETGKEKGPLKVNCDRKCAIMSRQCYMDDIGNVVCLNICDKEIFVCEEITN
jgi:hypothetical protein